MRNVSRAVCGIALFVAAGGLRAQGVTVTLHEPPPGQSQVENLWWVDIVNSTGETFHDVWLYGAIHKHGEGEVFHARSNRFDLEPGRKTVRLRDITLHDVWYRPGYEAFYYRAGRIPEGTYVYEVLLEPGLGAGVLEFETGVPDAPRLVSPPDRSVVEETQRYPLFAWARPAKLPRGARFRLTVVQVLPNQMPEEAVQANRPWLEEKLPQTSLQYPLRARALEKSKRYAWQVEVVLERTVTAQSEVWSFHYGDTLPMLQLLPLLPKYILAGGFWLEVKSCDAGSKLDTMAGQAQGSFFLPETVRFDVEFAAIGAKWTGSNFDSARLTRGGIVESFSPPLVLALSDAGTSAWLHELRLGPQQASASVSVELHKTVGDTAGGPALLGPFTFDVTPTLDLCVDSASMAYGPFVLRELGVVFAGKGVRIDLSPTGPPMSLYWRGVLLDSGRTLLSELRDTSNVGYLFGEYRFDRAVLDSAGFRTDMRLDSVWEFSSLMPLGYDVVLRSGEMVISRGTVDSCQFVGDVLFPTSVERLGGSPPGGRAGAMGTLLVVADSLDLFGRQIGVDGWVALGEHYFVRVEDGDFLLPADPVRPILPDFEDPSYDRQSVALGLDTMPLPGMTFSEARANLRTLWLSSPDLPDYDTLQIPYLEGWLNLGTRGGMGDLYSEEGLNLRCFLGRLGETGYEADSMFETRFRDSIVVRLVDNAVYDGWFQGEFELPYPTGADIPFRDLGFTSTGEAVGGRPVFDDTIELDYWGVGITSKNGAVSVRTGEVIYTDAEIVEKRHWDRGFHIYWGEMLADGGLGRFYFDYNSGNQKFDGIPFTIHRAALSRFDPKLVGDTLGHLDVKGDVHFQFWGSRNFGIKDYKYRRHDEDPWNRRCVKLEPVQFALYRNWGSGTAKIDFRKVVYDTADQDGFYGWGTVELKRGFTGKIPGMMDLSSNGTCIGYTTDAKDGGGGVGSGGMLQTGVGGGVKLGPVSGFIQIPGAELERIYVEGPIELSGSEALMGLGGRFQFNGCLTLETTPKTITVAGRAGLAINYAAVASVSGMAAAKFVIGPNSFEGDILLVFEAAPIKLSGAGQFSVWLSSATVPPGFLFQGAAKCDFKYLGRSLGAEGVLVLALNAPNEKLWGLGKIGRNVTARTLIDRVVPTNTSLTGFYGGAKFGGSLSLVGIISGGFWLWGGAGCFFVPSEGFVAMTNAGLLIHGDVLGVLVSADLWAEMGGAVKPPEFALQGSAGFEVSVLFVSYSWEGTISVSPTRVDAW